MCTVVVGFVPEGFHFLSVLFHCLNLDLLLLLATESLTANPKQASLCFTLWIWCLIEMLLLLLSCFQRRCSSYSFCRHVFVLQPYVKWYSPNVKLQQVHPMSSTCQHFVHCVNGMTWRRQIPPANGTLDCKCDDLNIVFPSSHLHTFHPSFIFTLLLSTMSPLPLSLLFSAFRHVVLC